VTGGAAERPDHYLEAKQRLALFILIAEVIPLKINMGQKDRAIRMVLGIAIIVAGVVTKSWWGAVGIIPLGTSLVRWCPAYLPFGISTHRTPTDVKP